MTKICKKSLITVFLALFFASLLCFFVSCGTDDGDEGNADTVKYSVTVKTDETTFAEGVRVTVKKGGVSFDPATTDANGKAEFELVPDSYTVTLSALPAHYSVPADADLNLTADKHDLTVTLSENFSYKVYLVNPDGTPYYAQGVLVGICTLTGNCLQLQPLEAGGVARCEGAKTDYEVQIQGLPEGVTFERGEGAHANYYTGAQFSATVTEMTITIYPVTVLDLSADRAMTEAEKQSAAYFTDNVKLPAHKFNTELAADGVRYFGFTAGIGGIYKIVYPSDPDISFKLFGGTGNTIYSGMELELQAGSVYYFAVSASAAKTAEFIIVSPVSTVKSVSGTSGAADLAFAQKNVRAIVKFTPTEAGKYTAVVKGSQKAAVELAANADVFAEGTATDFKENASCAAKMTQANLGNVLYFAVSLPGDVATPVSVRLEITKTAAITDTVTEVAVTDTLSKFTKPSGQTLTPVPYSTAESALVIGDDGYYHYNGKEGPVVTVLLTKLADEARFYQEYALAYMDGTDMGAAKYIFDVTSEEDKANPDKGNTFLDYRMFIRGFKDYVVTPSGRGNSYDLPATIADSYAKFVNEDGVYPLTEGLKTFLKYFCKYNSDTVSFGLPFDETVPKGNEWLFPLYYYAEDTAPADPIEGEYELVSFLYDGDETTYRVGDTYSTRFSSKVVTADLVTLNVTKTGFSLRDDLNEDSYSGTWSKTSDTAYTFTYTLFEEPATFAVAFDGASGGGTVTIVDSDNYRVTFVLQRKAAN